MEWSDLRFALTVRRRILAIQLQLGARLFQRTRDGFLPTPAGAAAIARAAAIERLSLALAQDVEGSNGRVEGPVRITALDGLIERFLSPRLDRLLRRHPGLELTPSSDLRLVDMARREADVAVRNAVRASPTRSAAGSATWRWASTQRVPRPSTGPCRWSACRARSTGPAAPPSTARPWGGAGSPCAPLAGFDIWAVYHVDLRSVPRVRAVVDFLAELSTLDFDLLQGRRPATVAP